MREMITNSAMTHGVADTTCDVMMDSFFALDKGERFPLALVWHVLTCKKCRTQVRLCTLAERVSAEPLRRPANDAEVALLLQRLAPLTGSKADSAYISLRRWIIAGVGMILAMMLFTLNPDAEQQLQLAFYIVFALVISVYCAFFIGSNLDFFVKKINTFAPAHR